MDSYILYDFSSALTLYAELDLKFIPTTVVIEDDDFTISLPMDAISVIEFPLAKVKEAMKGLEDFGMLDDGDDDDNKAEEEMSGDK